MSLHLFSHSFRYNVMCCHNKILKLVNLRCRQCSTEARLIAAITITLKVWGGKCQQEHWVEDQPGLWKSKLIPLHLRLAEHSDAKFWSQPLASRRLQRGSALSSIRVTQESPAHFIVRFYSAGNEDLWEYIKHLGLFFFTHIINRIKLKTVLLFVDASIP